MADYSLREGLRLAESYMESDSLSTICYLNTALLLKAKDDAAVREAISDMDMLVAGDDEILKAGGISFGSRKREVEGGFFLRELLRRFAKEKRRIFIIANSQDELVTLRESFLSIADRLTFFGSYAYGDLSTSEDAIINEINTVLPDVVISLVESPVQELMVSRSKLMLNTKLWITLVPEAVSACCNKCTRKNPVLNFIERRIFRRTVKHFDND